MPSNDHELNESSKFHELTEYACSVCARWSETGSAREIQRKRGKECVVHGSRSQQVIYISRVQRVCVCGACGWRRGNGRERARTQHVIYVSRTQRVIYILPTLSCEYHQHNHLNIIEAPRTLSSEYHEVYPKNISHAIIWIPRPPVSQYHTLNASSKYHELYHLNITSPIIWIPRK